MALSEDDKTTSVVVGVIRDLTKRVDDYEANSSADRADFKATIEASIVQLRRDFHAALAPIQLNEIDHRTVHENDRKERMDRQAANDANFRAIRSLIYVLIGLVGGFLVIGIVVGMLLALRV